MADIDDLGFNMQSLQLDDSKKIEIAAKVISEAEVCNIL